MRLFRRAQAGERDDLGIADCRDRRDAGADRLAVEMHRASAALRQAAAEMRIIQSEIVAQHIKERGVGIDDDVVTLAIDVQRKFFIHRSASSWRGGSLAVGTSRRFLIVVNYSQTMHLGTRLG